MPPVYVAPPPMHSKIRDNAGSLFDLCFEMRELVALDFGSSNQMRLRPPYDDAFRAGGHSEVMRLAEERLEIGRAHV